MLKLYSHPLSGNAYKVKLLLSFLKLNYEEIEVDLMAGEHLQPPFLALNPFGQIPVLTDGDKVLTDAQAILVYVARAYGKESADSWLPTDPAGLSEVTKWLSTAAGEVRQGPESARLYHLFGVANINIERANKRASFILEQLNNLLKHQEWLACKRPTVADVAVFPYVALAQDGQISLSAYPQVLAWIEQVKQLPGFVGMAGLA